MRDRSEIKACRSAGLTAALLLSAGAAVAQEPVTPPRAEYFLYVAAESEDQVALVRFGPGGAEIVREIPVGLNPTETDGPHGIAVDPARDRWYVSLAHGTPFGQVHAYSGSDGVRRGTVEAGLFPATMAIAPTGLLFVANFNLHGDPGPSSVSVVDTETMDEVARIPTCAMPHGSRLSPDGRSHYSVCMMDEQLVEIDARRLVVRRRLHLAPGHERALPTESTAAGAVSKHEGMEADAARCGPTWVQPSPDGGSAYVACNKNREVLEIDLAGWRVSRRFATGAGPYNLDVTPDGKLLVVTYKGGDATGVIEVAGGVELAAVPSTGKLPHGVAVSPDSRYAFVSVEGVGSEPGAVDMIDLKARKRVASVKVGRQAGGIGFWRQAEPGAR